MHQRTRRVSLFRMWQLDRLLRRLLCCSVLVRAATAQTPGMDTLDATEIKPSCRTLHCLTGISWTNEKKAHWRQTALEVYAIALLLSWLCYAFHVLHASAASLSSWLLLYCRFQHGYDSYMLHAFPHDELKPISQDYTDSLGDS